MKYDFPYKKGDTITLYKDYQTKGVVKGAAELVRFHKFGRSFILEEMMPETEQLVYNYQEWITTLDDKPHKISYLETIGITNSASDEEYDDDFNSKLIEDRFIEINGVQCF